MKILYVNHSLGALIGGGTHANELFGELNRCDGVRAERFPEAQAAAPEGTTGPGRKGLISRLGAHVPFSIMLFYQLWVKPLKKAWANIEKRIAGGDFDVVLIRPDLHLRLIPRLKQLSSPSLQVCVEVNALINEETTAFVPFRNGWLRREVQLIDEADSIMVVSEYLKSRLVHHGVDPGKIMVNPNGVNLERFDGDDRSRRIETRRSWGVPEEGYVFGYAGGMESFRRLPVMVDQIAEYLADDSAAWLVLVGDGDEMEEVRRRVAATSDEVGVRMVVVGRVAYERMPAALSAFDCGLFPYSNQYGSPQKLFEYMAMGLPVIGPNVPAVTEVFRDGEHLILTGQDGGNFVNNLERVRSGAGEALKMGKRGREFVSSQYRWSDNAERLRDFLESRR